MKTIRYSMSSFICTLEKSKKPHYYEMNTEFAKILVSLELNEVIHQNYLKRTSEKIMFDPDVRHPVIFYVAYDINGYPHTCFNHKRIKCSKSISSVLLDLMKNWPREDFHIYNDVLAKVEG